MFVDTVLLIAIVCVTVITGLAPNVLEIFQSQFAPMIVASGGFIAFMTS